MYSWQKKSIFSTFDKKIAGVFYPITIVLFALLINHYFNWNLQWDDISPLEFSLLPWAFLSAVGYYTIWNFLRFKTNFYKKLYSSSRNYKDFKKSKKQVWTMIQVTIFWVIQIIIFTLNKMAEFFYNWLNILLFLFPAIWATTILYLIVWFIYLKYKRKDTNIIF